VQLKPNKRCRGTKVRLLFALLGLAISFALPTYTQQKDVPDPQTTQKLLAGVKTDEEARNNNDPAAFAANYTRDAVFVTTEGPLAGRQAVQKRYTDLFQRWHPKNRITKLDGNAPHLIGTAGNELWGTGEWSETGQGKTGEPLPIKGCWSIIYVREADDWKIRMMAWNSTPDSVIRIHQSFAPQPAATPSRPPALSRNWWWKLLNGNHLQIK
jgi:ketosteroid isomerase-like protein